MTGSISRRHLLERTACGFGSLALAGLCQEQASAAPNGSAKKGAVKKPSLAEKPTHHRPRAKRVIFLFMQGGPSHVDMFDYKPLLEKYDGRQADFLLARTRVVSPERLFKSLWKFKRHGQSGRWVSELFPHMARCVDDFCLVRSMHTEGVAHGPATLFLHTGATNLIRPSVGSWITYGLGTESQNLPGFINISPPASKGGPRNYSNAFLPTVYQGTAIGRAGIDIVNSGIRNITNEHLPAKLQRKQLALLQAINQQQLVAGGGGDELEAVIASFELAYRMQNHAPGVMDLSQETADTQKMYGIGEPKTDDFGRQCLMARQFAEEGVRFIQVNYADNSATPRFDQHNNMPKHADHARAVDKPVAGLMQDLKARGLLEDTLVWWGGEFGRTPFAQGRDGRDHNPKGFSMWLAGGGVKPGIAYGNTDEFGYVAVENKVHMHDMHATILHLLGMNHENLTYRSQGRDFRLTDLYGRVISDIFA